MLDKLIIMQDKIEKIDVKNIKEILPYPTEFIEFCKVNNLKPPKEVSKNGKALSVMLNNPNKYWDRDTSEEFVKKFNIDTKDSIQLFNKHEQWGIKCCREKGKNYIIYPYTLTKKHKIRLPLNFNKTKEEKFNEIEKIKSTIMIDYIDIPNHLWQLGHKNPESEDNTCNNLVLQPPIQGFNCWNK